MIVAEIQEEAWARLTVHFILPRDTIRLAEWQECHRRAAPEKYLVGGEHAAVRRGCRAVEAFRGPQDRLHPQTRTVRVSNSLELLQMCVREKLIHFETCRMPGLECSRQSALHGGVLLWRIRCRKLAADLETVTVLHEIRVGVLGAVVRPKCARKSLVCHKPLHHTENGSRMGAGSEKRCPRT